MPVPECRSWPIQWNSGLTEQGSRASKGQRRCLIYIKPADKSGGTLASASESLLSDMRSFTEMHDDQVIGCCCFRLAGRNLGTRHDSGTVRSAGKHGDTGCSRVWRWKNAGQRRMRCKDDDSPYAACRT